MKIVVAYGGTSPEREVSLNSGAAVAKALEEAGHKVILEDVQSPAEFIKKWKSFDADGVFIALHGGWGENGYFQACLDAFEIPYTGSRSEACMYAMDKNVARLLFAEFGVKVPDGCLVRKGASADKALELLNKYEPVIIKPNSGGSTVGVTKASTEAELLKGLEVAWESEDNALVEQFIPGRELTVPVMEKEDGSVIALPAIDIRPKSGFYDYKNKYTAGCTEYLCPAPLSDKEVSVLSELAVNAHISLGCSIYSRVDFRMTEDGEMYALEVNTAPGMTATSLVPKSAKVYGMEFASFLEGVIKSSFKINK